MNRLTAAIGLLLVTLAVGTATASATTDKPHTAVALRSSWG